MRIFSVYLTLMLMSYSVMSSDQQEAWAQQQGPRGLPISYSPMPYGSTGGTGTGTYGALPIPGYGPTGAFGYWQFIPTPISMSGPTGYAPQLPLPLQKALERSSDDDWRVADRDALVTHFTSGKFDDEFLSGLHELSLQNVDFSQGQHLWSALYNSQSLVKLRVLNVSGSHGKRSIVNEFLLKLAYENRSLHSLMRINVQNSDIDFNTLESFRKLKCDPDFFVRDGTQISAKYECNIAAIQVDGYGTMLTDSQHMRDWHKAQEPGREAVVYYRNGEPSGKAKIKLIITN